MGKNRRFRQRDSELTRRKLLDAVSEIMREEGFAGLGTNAISRSIGRDKNLIRYHFSGLAGLQKAYIREKDYWPPFFERFAISSDSSCFEIEQLFVELMQENLRLFYSEVEMQKIILWQISEQNALMRSISDAREADGAKLLELSDPFFRGTEVNFRSVIALLLGGVYYMVLHANGNGSVVCGIDVHSEKDRADVLRTIGQVVSWSFAQADDGLGISTSGASSGFSGNGFSVLENFASRFSKFVSGGRENVTYLDSLRFEVNRLAKVLEDRLLEISDQVQLSSFIRVCMFRLVKLADRFYIEQEDSHPESALVLSLMEVFTHGFAEFVSPELVLPKLTWERAFFGLSKSAGQLERLLELYDVDPLLARVVKSPFLRFFSGMGTMTYGELAYLRGYLSEVTQYLEQFEVVEEELFFRLISHGENTEGLLDYLKERVRVCCEGRTGLERRNCLLSERKRIAVVEVSGEGTAKVKLMEWLDMELLRFTDGHVVIDNPLKFTSGLKVVELAYLMKLLYDQQVFGKLKLDVFAQLVAHNFRAVSGADISPGSVKSKLYPKDVEVIDAVEDLLETMLKDLRTAR